MQLFKRVLLSLFPDETVNQSINPASMFVSFISTKEFFSVINRKIVENYKLNLFDITIDPFEFKIGFGENTQIKQKDIDLYYGYVATANLNGYRLLNPANVANALALVNSIYVKDIFIKYGNDYYLNFLYTVFLMVFVFSARIKVFGGTTEQETYNRFIQVFFSFYEFIFLQTGRPFDKTIVENIKKDLLQNADLFFLLFALYKKCNTLLDNTGNDANFYSRLFYDELKTDGKAIINDFIKNSKDYTRSTKFTHVENKLLQSVLPADILIRYLFLDTNMFLVTESIVSKLYDKKLLDSYLHSFRKDDSQLESFLLYITDYKNYKKNFFDGVQKYVLTILKNNKHEDIDGELDDLMSSIGEDVENIENIENLKIPERIKKESKIMEKILNFYITFVGGFWIARGENFFLKWFKSPILDNFSDSTSEEMNEISLQYYGSLLYQYGKNVFYYKYVAENVRSGRQRFYLPYKSTSKNVYSNIHILKLFDQNFLAILFQDINPKDIRIYVKNKKILQVFRDLFGKEISHLVKKKSDELLENIYGPIDHFLSKKKLLSSIKNNFTSDDIYHLKDNLYNLDFWISFSMYKEFSDRKLRLNVYQDSVIMGIFSTLRETLLGFMLFNLFLHSYEAGEKKILHIDLIKDIYFNEILHIDLDPASKEIIVDVIEDITRKFSELFLQIISIDDNQDFLRMGMESREFIIENKNKEEIKKKLIGEDIVRLRGYLKNITYYNKRFLIPKS